MEDSENSSNNFSFQSFDKEKFKAAQSNNYKSIGSFVSKNNTYQSPGNSNNLEDIIFKELKENEKSYLDNGIYFKRKIEGSNPNTKRGIVFINHLIKIRLINTVQIRIIFQIRNQRKKKKKRMRKKIMKKKKVNLQKIKIKNQVIIIKIVYQLE